jgi:uncharacterized membrane protein YecN with MAPEG domain
MEIEPLITPLIAAICAFMLLALSVRVIRLRRRKNIPLHGHEDEDLHRAVRAQGNFTEYVPLSLLLLLLVELNGAPRLMVWALGAALLIGRALHVSSISLWEQKPQSRYRGRVAGMMLTFSVLGITAAYAMYQFYFGAVFKTL